MSALVCEGGALRGLYTAGALDALLDNNLLFKTVYGISAGSANSCSYVSRQRGRNLELNTKYCGDPRYIGYRNFLKTRSIMNLSFVFDEIPNKLVPFDFETFYASESELFTGITSLKTGKIEYFGKAEVDKKSTLIRATCAVPFMFPAIKFKDALYYDGGISCPIPIEKSLEDGNEFNLIITTRPKGTRKGVADVDARLYNILRRRSKAFAYTFINRSHVYNRQMEFCENLEKTGKAIMLSPKSILGVSSFEKNADKLKALYNAGYEDTLARLGEIKELINK